MDKIRLIDLIDVEALQRIQDGFSKYTGMASIVVDTEGTPITRESGFTRFCNGFTRKTELGCKNCEKCDRDGAYKALEDGKASAYLCHAGLMDFAAPIMVEGILVGGFIGGQVRVEETSEEEIIKKSIEYGIDSDEYVKAFKETSLLTKEDVEKAVVFIEEIASSLSLMAYKMYMELKESEHYGRVAKSQADYVMNMSVNLEHIMERWLKVIGDNIGKTTDDKVHDLLKSIQNDSVEVKNSIDDTIGFIKMSANDLEISEAEYKLSQLVNLLMENLGDSIRVVVTEAEHEILFGDVVRIWQMLSRIIKIIRKEDNKQIEILLSTKTIHYSTNLNILIIDKDTDYTLEEINRMKLLFDNESKGKHDDVEELQYSLEGVLLSEMTGKMVMSKKGNDFVLEISIPQIGL